MLSLTGPRCSYDIVQTVKYYAEPLSQLLVLVHQVQLGEIAHLHRIRLNEDGMSLPTLEVSLFRNAPRSSA